jgi:hypothetical protein
LQQNLADNRVRMKNVLRESAEIQVEFQRANISYAVLKGISLYPLSVPKPELRHQLDVDFLVDESCASGSREILEQAGYRLHGVSGRSWEFKKDEAPRFSTKNMYKDGFGRTVELHIEVAVQSSESLLSRREYRECEGITMPVLAPADLFLRQGMHVFKDICSPFLRASHLLELYRHVCARVDDTVFWSEVRSRAADDPRTIFGLGISLKLIEAAMAGKIPAEMVAWTVQRIPPTADRWVGMYGRRCVFGTPPGTKLYLLLQREMETAGISSGRPARAVLLPTRLPQVVIPARNDETLKFRFQRYALQLQFIFLRLRFHVVEGLRYAWASYRWRRQRNRFQADALFSWFKALANEVWYKAVTKR